jgi:pyroglutamyl-peptidase
VRILLTAFEPFDGTGMNASLAGCRSFLERFEGRFDLRFAVLPVAYGPDVLAVESALEESAPDLLLHTGQAGGSSALRVERIAVNVRYATHQLGPEPRPQQLIEPEGPAALFSTLDVDRAVEAIRAAGLSSVVSNHAGIYLCNHALYRSLRRAQLHSQATRIGFLHVPQLPEQRPSSPETLPAHRIGDAIHALLAELAKKPVRYRPRSPIPL